MGVTQRGQNCRLSEDYALDVLMSAHEHCTCANHYYTPSARTSRVTAWPWHDGTIELKSHPAYTFVHTCHCHDCFSLLVAHRLNRQVNRQMALKRIFSDYFSGPCENRSGMGVCVCVRTWPLWHRFRFILVGHSYYQVKDIGQRPKVHGRRINMVRRQYKIERDLSRRKCISYGNSQYYAQTNRKS